MKVRQIPARAPSAPLPPVPWRGPRSIFSSSSPNDSDGRSDRFQRGPRRPPFLYHGGVLARFFVVESKRLRWKVRQIPARAPSAPLPPCTMAGSLRFFVVESKRLRWEVRRIPARPHHPPFPCPWRGPRRFFVVGSSDSMEGQTDSSEGPSAPFPLYHGGVLARFFVVESNDSMGSQTDSARAPSAPSPCPLAGSSLDFSSSSPSDSDGKSDRFQRGPRQPPLPPLFDGVLARLPSQKPLRIRKHLAKCPQCRFGRQRTVNRYSPLTLSAHLCQSGAS